MDASNAINDTQMGMLKAMHFIMTPPKRRKVKQKFFYEHAGSRAQPTRCLTAAERKELTPLVNELALLHPKKDAERLKEILAELGKRPVQFVPVKREHQIDYSKIYPYRSTKRGGYATSEKEDRQLKRPQSRC